MSLSGRFDVLYGSNQEISVVSQSVSMLMVDLDVGQNKFKYFHA